MTMAALSDQLLLVTVFGYLAAMSAYAAELGFGQESGVASVVRRELIGAGIPTVTAEDRASGATPRGMPPATLAGYVAVTFSAISA
jgi:hypothetical protein